MWPFKKKEDELAAFERELGLNADRTGIKPEKQEESFDKLKGTEMDYSIPKPTFEEQKPAVQLNQQDLQLVSAKLDTIKSMLDLLNQRMANLEKNVEQKQKEKIW